MTFAHFQTLGNTPSVRDLLIKPVRIGAMTSEASFNKRVLSLSSPTLLDFKDLRALRTKFTPTLSRWNSEGGVLEVKQSKRFPFFYLCVNFKCDIQTLLLFICLLLLKLSLGIPNLRKLLANLRSFIRFLLFLTHLPPRHKR